ncbi:hypothetical protein [Nakamurella alba]|nr:hypothetical protein [Nakamurella alba]
MATILEQTPARTGLGRALAKIVQNRRDRQEAAIRSAVQAIRVR